MAVEVGGELADGGPAAADARIHHLHERPDFAPDDDEMRGAGAGQTNDNERGQQGGGGLKDVVRRHHDLFGVEAQLARGVLHSVDGSAVDVGLAGFAEAAVVGCDAEAVEEAFEGRRSAVHVGGLDHFGREELAEGGHSRGYCQSSVHRAAFAIYSGPATSEEVQGWPSERPSASGRPRKRSRV